MPDTSTVFQAKLEAINYACHYAIAQITDFNITCIKILSDSQAAIQGQIYTENGHIHAKHMDKKHNWPQ